MIRGIVRRCGCCFVLPVLLLGLLGGGFWFNLMLQPVSRERRMVHIMIRGGAHPKANARELQQKGLIRSELAFLWVATRKGDLARMKSGVYDLSPDMAPDQIVDRLAEGGRSGNEVAVTIPEGFTLRQIAETLSQMGVVRDKEAFLRIGTKERKSLQAPFDLAGPSLEGFLFPETYRFKLDSKPQSVAQTMLNTFSKEFYEPNKTDIHRSGRPVGKIVTIASLIEREARIPRDRSRIAGVIENRIKRGMRLEIDATVLYALGHHKDRVLYTDLNVKSPYNTYRDKGLPPGPIASPGKESLLAALHPEKNDYLFYVAAPGGSHLFSRTLAEHNHNKALVRAQRRANL